MSNSVPLDPSVLEAHVAGARSLARALLHDPDAADDAVQEACVVALTKPPRAGWDFRAWFAGVVRNKAREQRRALARRAGALADEPRGPAPEPDLAERMETQRRLFVAVLALPEAYRTVVWLRHFEDLPPREIAARLVVPVETVRTRHRRALDLLRDALGGASGPEARRWTRALLPIAAPGGPGGGSALGPGGLLMTLGGKTAVGLGAAALLVAGFLLWRANDRGDAPAGESLETTEEPGTSAPTLAGRAAPPALPGDATAAEIRVPTWTVTGRVLDEDHTPLAGAELRWSKIATLDVAAMTPVARTGADGTFQAAVPVDAPHVRLVAEAPGRRASPAVARRGFVESVEFRLLGRRDLFLRVVDGDTGVPIEGVTCESVVEDGGADLLLTAVTDAEGRVTVADPDASGLERAATVRVRKEGYVPLLQLARDFVKRRGAADRPLDVYLRRGVGLRVRVVDASGRPAAGATVAAWMGSGARVWVEPGNTDAWLRRRSSADEVPLGVGTSDEEGLVMLGAVAERQRCSVLATRGTEVGFAAAESPDPTKALDIVLHPAFEVTGKVTDEEGRPLVGAWVRYEWYELLFRDFTPLALSWELEQRRNALTDAEGRYRLAAVPLRGDGAEQWLHAVHADAAARERLNVPSAGDAVVQVDFRLKPVGEPVRVRVLDARSGAPVPGASVSWETLIPTTPTDADGFATRFRHPRGTWPLSVRAPGYAPWRGDGPPATNEVEVRLEKTRPLAGFVLDPDGRGVIAYVDVFQPAVAALPDEERAKRQVYGLGWLGRGESGETGAFRVDNLPPGPLFVRAWARRNGPKGLLHPQVEGLFAQGDAVELRMPTEVLTAEPLQEVTGAVFDANGQRVTLYSAALEGENRHATAAQTGWEFRFVGLRPGSYVLLVSERGGSRKGRLPVVVRHGEDVTGVRVTLGDSAVLMGRLVPPADVPLEELRGVAVDIAREGQPWAEGIRLEKDGTFRAKDLVPGPYVVSLRAGAATGAWQIPNCRIDVAVGGPPRDFPVVAAGRLVLAFDDARFAAELKMEHYHDPDVQAALLTQLVVRFPDGREVKDAGLFRGRHARKWAFLPGTYELEIDHAGGLGSFRTAFRATGGADTTVEVVLSK